MKILSKIIFLGLLIISSSLSLNIYALDIDYSLIGKPAPNFELPALSEKKDGKVIKLSNYKGKLLLINFWASWCGPCRAEIPTLTKLQETYKDKRFTIIGLAMESKEDADKFIKGQSINYPNAYGEESIKKILEKYGNPDGILPFSVLVNPQQNIISIYPGIIGETKMQRVLGRLLDNF